MCTDKWRNLLKEFKKAKHHQDKGSGSAKMSYYKEIEEILKDRNKNGQYKSPTPPKVDSFMQFSDKGMEDTNISFAHVEGMAVKVCLYDEPDNIPVHTEEKIFYTEDDYGEFLTRRGWTCLREFDGYRNIENMDDLGPGAIYRGLS
ncbi:hypothetical protein ACLB2K_075638 [Fragaria x ananassa]